ncbi:MAG: glycerol-3-phosphate dehydrogenase [Hyphomicrobiaceae bacterium]|nr:MAG: glycerol-3-phosphate dehydrogenase [Hyphomicrobiaceae bacterium]
MQHVHDLAIIGGGINGCGIARDAAGRGLSVYLCEMNDLGSGTSSRSTKLIHGGLRYLEHFDFRLVREALTEREVLWGIAPHIIRPMRFVLPHQQGLRPAWMLRVGLFLYDHLGGRERLPGTAVLDLATDSAGTPLKPGVFNTGFEYSDCWVDDARLVVLNARDAADRGAVIRPRTRAVSAERRRDLWHMTVEEEDTRRPHTIAARALVNAAGPWVGEVLGDRLGMRAPAQIRLVQGSHIVVPKLFEHDRAYLFQNPDGRVVFAIPYENEFTLIGTTDRDYAGDPADVSASGTEIAYLCETASACFARAARPEDVVWAYAGVRPLHDDGTSDAKAASRDYVLEMDEAEGAAPLLSIIGGKITTYRRLAEATLERLAPHLPGRRGLDAGWTGHEPLPGGAFDPDGVGTLAGRLQREHPFLSVRHALRLVRAYGTRAQALLRGASTLADLGRSFGATLTEAEVRYLIDHEWARTAEDVLWRRSKLGLHLTAAEAGALEAWMREAAPAGTASS